MEGLRLPRQQDGGVGDPALGIVAVVGLPRFHGRVDQPAEPLIPHQDRMGLEVGLPSLGVVRRAVGTTANRIGERLEAGEGTEELYPDGLSPAPCAT